MKKHIHIIFAIILIVVLSSAFFIVSYADNQTPEIDEARYWSLFPTLYPKETTTEVTIPEGIVEIPESIMQGYNFLTKVTLPSSVRRIGARAMKDCRRLSDVTIPHGVELIGASAFSNTASLRSLSLPATVTWIGEGAISVSRIYSELDGLAGRDLRSFSFGSNPTVYYASEPLTVVTGNCGKNATYTYNIEKQELVISGTGDTYDYGDNNRSVRETENYLTFWNTYACYYIKSIIVEEGITSLGDNIFYGCYHAKSIQLPSTLKRISYSALPSIEVTDLFIPAGVEEIVPPKSGYWVGNIPNVHFEASELPNGIPLPLNANVFFNGVEYEPKEGKCGDNLTWKYDKATQYLYIKGTGPMYDYEASGANVAPWIAERLNPKKIYITEGVTSVGAYAFYNMSTTIAELADTIQRIGTRAFSFSTSTGKIEVDLPADLRRIDSYAFSKVRFDDINFFPPKLEYVANEAFLQVDKNKNTKAFFIPKSVTTLGTNSQLLSDAVIFIEADKKGKGNGWPDEGPGVYYSFSKANYDYYFGNRTMTENMIIPEGVTVLTQDFAPLNYTGSTGTIQTLSLPESLKRIDTLPPMRITEIAIPKSVEKISAGVFENCFFLQKIYCNAESKPEGWSDDWLSGCSAEVVWFEPTPVPTPKPTPKPTLPPDEIAYLSLTSKPAKLTYELNEEFDPAGMVITVTYGDKRTEVLGPEELTISTPDISTEGTKNITVTYKGKSINFNVVYENHVGGIKYMVIEKKPTRLSYFMGDTFDPDGMKVKVTYINGTTEYVNIENLEISKPDNTLTGVQNVNVTYLGVTRSFAVKFAGRSDVRAIKVVKKPTKLIYDQGERFDFSGIEIRAVAPDLTITEVISPDDPQIHFFGFRNNEAGLCEIKVVYMECYTATFSIKITTNKVVSSYTVTKPTKLVYNVGEAFDMTGMTATVNYYDGTTAAMSTSGFTTDFDNTTKGLQSVNIIYKGTIVKTITVKVV